MESPRFTVEVDGVQLERVSSLNLRLSITELADSFNLEVVDKVDVVTGSRVVISIEGRAVLVGEVMNYRRSKTAGNRSVTISGFSAAQRLVKSSVVAPSRTMKGLTLRQIVESVVEPFGLVVDVSEPDVADEVLDLVKIGPGQKAAEFLKAVCKRQGCILVSGAASISESRTAKASVRITRASARDAPVTLVYPSERVLSFDLEDDVREVHSQYFVNRRGRGTRDKDGTLKGLDGVAEDDRVLYSPIIIQAEAGGRSQAALNRQAEWEMRRRAAEGLRVSIEVDGWSPRPSPIPPSPLWWPNTLMRIVDTEDNFDDKMLLTSADISINIGGGSRTRLEFVPPDAYAQLEQRKIRKPKRGSVRSGRSKLKDYLAKHSGDITKVTRGSDTPDFGNDRSNVIYKPEDPDA
jgi:prophage tail gpP-like protein